MISTDIMYAYDIDIVGKTVNYVIVFKTSNQAASKMGPSK